MVDYTLWNITGIVNGSSSSPLLDMTTGVSRELNFIPGIAMMVAVFIIFFLVLYQKSGSAKNSLLASSFASAVLAIVLYPAGILSGTAFIFFVVGCGIAIFLSYVLE